MKRSKLSAKKRRRLYKIVGQIYRLLEDDFWTFHLECVHDNIGLCSRHGISPRSEGFCDHEKEQIYIDFRYDLLSILIHECLHAIYDEWEEQQILDLEQFVIYNISPIQAKRILQKAVAKLV